MAAPLIGDIIRIIAPTSRRRWLHATVSSGDAAHGRFGIGATREQQFVLRMVQLVGICASRNAWVCSRIPMRLYAPERTVAGARRFGVNARSATTRRTKSMRAGRMGTKAADYAEYAGEFVEVTNHPVLELLRRPSPLIPGDDLSLLRWMHKEVVGQCLLSHNGGDGNSPSEMLPLYPQFTHPIVSREGFIEGWRYGRDGSYEAVYPCTSVMQLKHAPDPSNPYAGRPWMANVVQEADTLSAIATATLSLWSNGARPDWLLRLPPEMNEQQVEQALAQVESAFRGPQKNGRIMPATVAGIEALNWVPKDMEGEKAVDWCKRMILAAADIPESEFELNDANLASSRVGSTAYMTRGIQPRINRDAEQLTEMLLPLFGIEPGEMWFAYDDPLSDDQLAEYESQRLDVQAGIITADEARAERGLDPLPESSVPSTPSIGIPGLFRSAKHFGLWVPPSCCTHVKDDDFSPLLTDAERRAIRRLERALRRWYQTAYVGALSGLNPTSFGGFASIQGSLEDVLRGEFDAIMRLGVEVGASELGADTPEVMPESALRELERYVPQLAREILESEEAAITDAIRRGLEGGMSTAQIADEIEKAGVESVPWKAERIARTETSNVVQAGKLAEFEDQGVKETEWLLATAACPICTAIVRRYKSRPIGQPYARAGETLGGFTFKRDIRSPAAHPNCRCTLNPKV